MVSPVRLLGIDIGATTTAAVVIDASMTVLATATLPTGHGRADVAATAVAASHQVITASGLDPADIAAAGIGVPGLVDPEKGTTRLAVNLGIDGEALAIGPRVAQALGLPTAVENDVRAAADAAYQWALADDPSLRHLVYVSIGTGISAGVILNGSIHRGVHGVAGEIGHITVSPDGARCRCGLDGCLETVASGAANRGPWGREEQLGMSGLFAAADDGDHKAVNRARQVTFALARMAHLLILTYGPDRIVLGGGVVAHTPRLVAAVGDDLAVIETASPVAAAVATSSRVHAADPSMPLGAIGAALTAARRHDIAVPAPPVPASNEQGA